MSEHAISHLSPSSAGRSVARIIVLAILYVLLAGLAMGARPWKGETFGPFDLLSANAGFGGKAMPKDVKNWERSDVLDTVVPGWIQARDQIREGRWLWWNPVAAGGVPGAQNAIYGILTPAFVAFAAAPDPSLGFYLSVLVSLALAGLGMHLWLWPRLGHVPALFAGIGFMFCGFITAWLFWPQAATAAMIPWLLLTVDRWWVSASFNRFLLLSLACLLLYLGGFPFAVELGIGAALLYLVCLAFLEPRGSAWARLSILPAACVLAVCLGAIPVLALVEWLANHDLAYRHGGSGLTVLRDAPKLLGRFAMADRDVERSMYAGTPALVLMLGLIPWLAWRRVHAPVLVWFSLALTLVGVVLTFGLVPYSWVGWVPGLSNNSWSRAILILDLGITIGGATMLSAILRFGRRHRQDRQWLALAVMALVVASFWVQGKEQFHYFRAFNGRVPAAWFYPRTPLINRMKTDLRPFQYVVADSKFLVSGTLGAYGLPEWFAHAFKASQVRVGLEHLAADPFTTPTASRLAAQSIHLDSPWMSWMGVRYVVGGGGLVYRKQAFVGEAGERRAIAPLPVNAWKQTFDIEHDTPLLGVAIRLATYGRSELQGTVSLEFSDSTGQELARATLPAAAIADNEYSYFTFPQAIHVPAGRYSFRLNYHDAGASRLSAWAVNLSMPSCTLAVGGHEDAGCLDFALLPEKRPLGAFHEIKTSGGVYLLENTAVPNGAYWVSGLDQDTGNSPSANTEVVDDVGSSFAVRYSGKLPGWVVLPMSSLHDWQVTTAGVAPVRALYKGVLPAIQVNGPAQIEFHYAPMARWLGIPLTAITWSVTLIVGVWLEHRRRVWCKRRIAPVESASQSVAS